MWLALEAYRQSYSLVGLNHIRASSIQMGRTEVSHPALSIHNSGSCKGWYSKLATNTPKHLSPGLQDNQGGVNVVTEESNVGAQSREWELC